MTTRQKAEAIQHPTTAVPGRTEGELWGHPKGLYVLFFTEMWERFSFYSMRGILTLYMVQALLFSEGVTNKIYGAYLGFVYSTTFIGGILADRVLGQRRAIIIGGFLMAAAQFALAGHALIVDLPPAGAEPVYRDTGLYVGLEILFFFGMATLAAGNGFFKPNISTIVGSLYPQGDPRRDGAFTIFYMGINIGALLAGFSGQIAQQVGWHWGFLLAGVGMVIGQIIFFAGRKFIAGRGLPPKEGILKAAGPLGVPNAAWLALGVIILIPIISYLLSQPAWVKDITLWIAIPVLLYLLYEAFRSPAVERDRMIVIIVLCIFAAMFWGFFELAGSAIVLFTEQSIDTTVPIVGKLESSFLNQSLNPAFIILLGIPFAKLWVWLDKRRMDPSSPLKFSLGIAQVGLGFLVLFVGAMRAAETGKCNIMYLVLAYFLHTTGELCLSPVGLSMVTKLSPARLVGMFMGVWFLSSAFGNVLIGFAVGENIEERGYGEVFKWIGIISIASALLLLILYPLLKRMQHGVK